MKIILSFDMCVRARAENKNVNGVYTRGKLTYRVYHAKQVLCDLATPLFSANLKGVCSAIGARVLKPSGSTVRPEGFV